MIRRLAIATVFACWAALIGLACRPLPDPQEPPGPAPEPIPPSDVDAGPVATTPCGRAAQHAVALGCVNDATSFEGACSRYEQLGGAFRWNPDPCMVQSASCEELEGCRSE